MILPCPCGYNKMPQFILYENKPKKIITAKSATIQTANLRDQKLAFYRVDALLHVLPDLRECKVLLMKMLVELFVECELWHRRMLTASLLYWVCPGDQ